jgi:hypothetical protein
MGLFGQTLSEIGKSRNVSGIDLLDGFGGAYLTDNENKVISSVFRQFNRQLQEKKSKDGNVSDFWSKAHLFILAEQAQERLNQLNIDTAEVCLLSDKDQWLGIGHPLRLDAGDIQVVGKSTYETPAILADIFS